MSKQSSLKLSSIGVIIPEVGVITYNWVNIITYDIMDRKSITPRMGLEEDNELDITVDPLHLVSEGLRHSVLCHALSIYHPLPTGVVYLNETIPISGWKWGFRWIFNHTDLVPHQMYERPDVNLGPWS